ncbi:MAG: hypothetical protein H7315_13880 [Herminiimonas sp.]|nr:hypothetical protein [Herminiimonas sp.]
MKQYLAVAALAVVLSACGGGSDNPPAAMVETPPPAPVVDAFTAGVTTVVASNSDTAEPAAFDSIAATSPETTEPTPVS